MKKNCHLINEAQREILEAEKREVSLAMGTKFVPAIQLFMKLNNITSMSVGQYREAMEQYSVVDKFVNGADDVSLDFVAQKLCAMFGGEVPADEEEKKAIVQAHLARFQMETTTENLHKRNSVVIKATDDDVNIDERGVGHINTAKAEKMFANVIDAKINEKRSDDGKLDMDAHFMRIVGTSENGVYREYSEFAEFMQCTSIIANGMFIMLYMGKKTGDPAVDSMRRAKKFLIFKNGFVDDATGIHYMFAMKSASMTRKAIACFVPAKNWDEIFQLWFWISGLKTKEGFIKAFGDHLNFAKMLARLSSRASSSFSTDVVNPELGEKIRQAKVIYVKDRTISVSKAYKTLTAPNVLVDGEGEREITVADGAAYGSVTFHALIALAMRIVSASEYSLGMQKWKFHVSNGGSLASASGSLLSFLQKVCIPFQIRTGSWKGMLPTADLETAGLSAYTYGEVCTEIPEGHTEDEYINIAEYDIVCPESVRKYQDGGFSEYPFEICGYLKNKKGTVELNPQFINALEWDTPNALLPIVKDVIRQAEESLDDPAKAMAFHHLFGEGSEVATLLGDALRTDATLINETYIQSQRYAQYEKLINGMALGRIPVPGTYTYMIADPYAFLNETFGISLPCLAEGEFFFNGKTCNAGLFRSPLIHPFEAQKVQLVEHPAYNYMKDVAVFNIYDGVADKMGGADFDGDTCAVIPDDTWQGDIIVKGIRNFPYDVWEKGAQAKKQYFVPDTSDEEAMNNLINFLVESTEVDRTGIITNYGTAALELSNHLRGLVFFARYFDVDTIRFVHPKTFGPEGKWGSNYAPRKYGNVLMARGFVEGHWSKKDKGYAWSDDKELSIVGDKTIDEVLSLSNDYLRLVEIVRVLQGREIDGAKTGVHAEGPRFNPQTGEGNDFTENVMVKFVSRALVDRQFSLGRIEDVDAKSVNTYVSVSPWGRAHSYINEEMAKEDSVLNRLKENGIVKTAHFMSLLTAEEKAHFDRTVVANEKTVTLVELIKMWKDHYATQMKLFFDVARATGTNVNNEEQAEETFGTLTVASIKSSIAEQIEAFATQNGIPMTTIAVACYIANFAKSNSITEGNSFAWMFSGSLLEVASRNNAKYRWVRVPSEGEVSISDGILSVAGKDYSRIEEAEDCMSCLTTIINGRRYAWVHVVSSNAVKPVYEGRLYEGKEYIYNLYGFAQYGVITPELFIKFEGYSIYAKMCKEGSNAGRVELFAQQNGSLVPFCSIANSKDLQANMNLAGIDDRMLKIVSAGEAKGKSVRDVKFIVIA